MKVRVTGGIFVHNENEYQAGDILDVPEKTYKQYKFTLEKVKGKPKITPGKSVIKSTLTRSTGKK